MSLADVLQKANEDTLTRALVQNFVYSTKPRDAQRDKSKQAKRSLTTLRESRRAEKWSGNEKYIDISEYERDTKQEGIQKKRSKWCFSAFMQQSPGHSATAEQEKQGAHRS